MSSTWRYPDLAERAYDRGALLAELGALVERLRMDRDRQLRTRLSIRELGEVLDGLAGETLQDRWGAFEWEVWPQWLRGIGRASDHRWSVGVSTLVSAQAVRPSWPFLECTYTRKWVKLLPDDAPLQLAAGRLTPALEDVSWSTMALRDKALKTALRIMMVAGYTELDAITD
jgi:hypothetical protein